MYFLWLLIAVTQAGLISSWLHHVFEVQPTWRKHPLMFQNPAARVAMIAGPPAGITLLTAAAFYLTDSAWLFLTFTAVWFLLHVWVMKIRIRNFIPAKPYGNEIARPEIAIIRMIDLRRKFDCRMKAEPPASHWAMWRLWEVPETLIFNAVEFSESMQDDGYTEEESIQKILSSLNLELAGGCTDLFSYLKFRLATIDSEYLPLGILEEAVSIAKAGARAEIEKRKKNTAYPPAEWLQYEASNSDLQTNRQACRDMVRLLLRRRPDDEIRIFSTPSALRSSWVVKGFALLRQGELIDHAVTDKMHINYGPP